MSAAAAKTPQGVAQSLAAYLDALTQGQSEQFTSARGRPVVVGQRIPISGETGALCVELRAAERSTARGGRLYECFIVVRLEAQWSLLVTASGPSVHTAVAAAAKRAVRGAETRLGGDDCADSSSALAKGDAS